MEQEGVTEQIWDKFIDLSSKFNALIKQLENLNNQHYAKNDLSEVLEHQFYLYKNMLDNYKSVLERRRSLVVNGVSPYSVDIDYYNECFTNYHNLVNKYGNAKTRENCIHFKQCLNDLEAVSDDEQAELLLINFHEMDRLAPLKYDASSEDREKREDLIKEDLVDLKSYKNSTDQCRRELIKYRETMFQKRQEMINNRKAIFNEMEECHNSVKAKEIKKRLNFIEEELNKKLDPIARNNLIDEYYFLGKFHHKDLLQLQKKFEKYSKKIKKVDDRIVSVNNEIALVLKKVELIDKKAKILEEELNNLEDFDYLSNAKRDKKWLANRMQNYAKNGNGPGCQITIKDLKEFSKDYNALNGWYKFVRGVKNIFSGDPEVIVGTFLNSIRKRSNENRALSNSEMRQLKNLLPNNIIQGRDSSNKIISYIKKSRMSQYKLKKFDKRENHFSYSKFNKNKGCHFKGIDRSYKSRLSERKPEQQESIPSLQFRING